MIPKKLIIFAALVLGGLAYLLKDRSLNEIQPAETRAYMEKKEELKKLAKDPKALEKEAAMKAKERGHQYVVGNCLTNHKEGWEFTKILAIGEKTYRVVDCHKYKGCTEQQDVSWADIEYEYRHGRIIACSR